MPHTKDRGKEKGEPKQLQHEKSVKGKNIMKRTRTPKRSALPRKMTALFLTLVLLLPLFCFGSYALEEDAEPEINGYQAVINETHYKFGEVPLGRYDDETDSIESLDRERITNNIGGRDVVVDYSMLHTVYSQSNHGVMYMNKTGGNS